MSTPDTPRETVRVPREVLDAALAVLTEGYAGGWMSRAAEAQRGITRAIAQVGTHIAAPAAAPPPAGAAEAMREAWSADALDAIERAAKMIEDEQQEVVHETWFYDGSCNSWDAPSPEAEDQDIEIAALVKAIRALPPAAPSDDVAVLKEALTEERACLRQMIGLFSPAGHLETTREGVLQAIADARAALGSTP